MQWKPSYASTLGFSLKLRYALRYFLASLHFFVPIQRVMSYMTYNMLNDILNDVLKFPKVKVVPRIVYNFQKDIKPYILQGHKGPKGLEIHFSFFKIMDLYMKSRRCQELPQLFRKIQKNICQVVPKIPKFWRNKFFKKNIEQYIEGPKGPKTCSTFLARHKEICIRSKKS